MLCPMRRQRILNRFGKVLDDVLAEHGLSNAKFSRLANIPRSTLSHLKLRPPTTAPSLEEVRAWGKAAGMTAAQILALHDAIQLSFSPQYVQEVVDRLRKKPVRPER